MDYIDFAIENVYSDVLPDYTYDQLNDEYNALEASLDQWMGNLSFAAMEASNANITQDELDKLAIRSRKAARKLKAAKESGDKNAMREAKKELDRVQKEIAEADKSAKDIEKKKKIKKVAAILLGAVAAAGIGVLAYKAIKNHSTSKSSASSGSISSSSSNSGSSSSITTKSSSSGNNEFDKSVKSARASGVPENKILKNKEEIDNYFTGSGSAKASSQDKHTHAQSISAKNTAEKAIEKPDDNSISTTKLLSDASKTTNAIITTPMDPDKLAKEAFPNDPVAQKQAAQLYKTQSRDELGSSISKLPFITVKSSDSDCKKTADTLYAEALKSNPNLTGDQKQWLRFHIDDAIYSHANPYSGSSDATVKRAKSIGEDIEKFYDKKTDYGKTRESFFKEMKPVKGIFNGILKDYSDTHFGATLHSKNRMTDEERGHSDIHTGYHFGERDK